ncbi:DNA-binding transcriptional LysR family regulator [Breoghania corrubedonensis]|uniref:DNA-binding transcriptional LysR family regulator n=1 Tax=Breoghania corrubedonensis TaxID=665038 RepID=A0A2T5VG33_9HYPH|nr:LysR family transcriptional regulator [Breoghania corrubedonensis]PTW62724.1 DNA-binding transcriptional LysR family regulator [Breoghania corrubedonensis]
MELKWLEDFVMLASVASFSRAAAARNVTQSAFSRRIKQLETWLGVTLISRASLPAALTPEGKAFLPVAQEAIRMFYNARNTLTARSGAGENCLTFAALHTLTVTMMPDWLSRIRETIPHLTTALIPDRGGIEANADALVNGEADLFLTYTHPFVPLLVNPDQFDWLHLGEETVIPVAAPQLQSFAGNDARPGRGLLDRAIETGETVPYLDYGLSSFFGTALQRIFFEKKPFRRHNVHQNTISAELRTFALKGWGVCWLPEGLLGEDLATGALVRASEDPQWDMHTQIRLYRYRGRDKQLTDEFWRVVSTMLPGSAERETTG